MTIATYSQLQTSILQFLARPGDSDIPVTDLITLAESEFNRVLKTRFQETSTTITTIANTATYSLPSDLLNIRELRILAGTCNHTLQQFSPDTIDEYPHTSTGIPYCYCIEANSIRIHPTPSASGYVITLGYFQKIPALSVSNTTNWLLTNWCDLYLYSALSHAELFLGGDATEERIATFQQKKSEIYQGIDLAERRHRMTSGPVGMSYRRAPYSNRYRRY